MSDSERVRELEGKLRAWRWGALAGAALLVATAGVTVAETVRLTRTQDAPIPPQNLVLELPSSTDLKVEAKGIEYHYNTRSYNLSGQTRLRWGSGYSLNMGSGYAARVESEERNGSTRITLTPAPAP